MPHSVSTGRPEARASGSAPDPLLEQFIVQAFLDLDQAGRDRVDAALDEGKLDLRSDVERRLVERLSTSDELFVAVSERVRSALLGTRAESEGRRRGPGNGDWLFFWARHSNRIDEFKSRVLFFALPWTVAFQRDFWEGHERHLLWAEEWRKPAESPYWWLYNRKWTDQPVDRRQRKIIGPLERQRLRREVRLVQAAIGPVADEVVRSFDASKAIIPEPPPLQFADGALGDLQRAFAARIGEGRYRMWFLDKAKLELSEGALIVNCADPFVKDWVRQTFARDLRQVAHGELRFQIKE